MKELATSNGFAMQPASMTEAMELAAMLASSSMVPPAYKSKAEDTLVAMMMGSELGLNPIQALQNIAVINGRPSIYGDAMLALVQKHHAFVRIDESFDKDTMTAKCTVERKNGNPYTVYFSRADAEDAGLWGKQGPWKQYPKRMLQMRARGFALRDQFADALLGIISAEEAMDMQPEPKNITPESARPAETSKPAIPSLPAYSDADIEKNMLAWAKAIKAEKITAEGVIDKITSTYTLSNEQAEKIMSLEAVA